MLLANPRGSAGASPDASGLAVRDRGNGPSSTPSRLISAAAFHGRRHGLRIARSGPQLHRLIEFADGLAELLTDQLRRK
jgi:hypothetical protein